MKVISNDGTNWPAGKKARTNDSRGCTEASDLVQKRGDPKDDRTVRFSTKLDRTGKSGRFTTLWRSIRRSWSACSRWADSKTVAGRPCPDLDTCATVELVSEVAVFDQDCARANDSSCESLQASVLVKWLLVNCLT